jgi:Tfp pilus assembly protein PilF
VTDGPGKRDAADGAHAFDDAVALHKAGRLAEAEAAYQRILAGDPAHAEALIFLGVIANQRGRHHDALRLIDRALEANPRSAIALVNRGVVLLALQRPEEALESFDHALEIRPDYAEAVAKRGNALRSLRRPREALLCYEKARTLRPDYDEARWSESMCRLLMGDFENGWRQYEWRWKQRDYQRDRREFSQPLWLGEQEVAGRTILLHAEQGFGDTIQFCRYATLLATRGARVILEVQPPLKSLLARLSGPAVVLGAGEALPDFDLHCPLMSLPLACGTTLETVPAAECYLTADRERVAVWSARLGSTARPRVGLVWSGNRAHGNDYARSIALAELLERLDGSGAAFVSLQKDVRPHDRATLAVRPDVLHCGDELRDFDDTAALIESMDLVISVDTSVAHLAGALGKPVWVLLPYAPDWRWLLEREDSPWYPTARLFRQARSGDWDGVLSAVTGALADFGTPCSSAC